MQPVLPSTIVRGPDALTISFITRADSHPWHVRWPEVKYSSSGTFFTPLKGSSCCVGRVAMASAMSFILLLLPDADPLRRLELLARGRAADLVGHLPHVWHGHLAPTQPADEGEQRRPGRRVVERGADLVRQHPAEVRGAEGVVAVDDAHALEAGQRLGQSIRGEGPEPAQPDETHLDPLLSHLPDRHLHRHGEGTHAHH